MPRNYARAGRHVVTKPSDLKKRLDAVWGLRLIVNPNGGTRFRESSKHPDEVDWGNPLCDLGLWYSKGLKK